MSSQLTWFEMRSVCGFGRFPVSLARTPMIQALAARKRFGQPEAPNSNLVRMWTGAAAASSRPRRPMRMPARSGEPFGLAVAVESDAVQLHPVIDEAKPELLGDPLL